MVSLKKASIVKLNFRCIFGKVVDFKKYPRGVCDAGTLKFRSGTHGLNEELGRHRGREGRKECFCVMQSVRVLVMCCGIVLHTQVFEVPSCWS